MNWTRCSKVALAVALLTVVAVGPAAAVEATAEGVPGESEVGTEARASFELTDLYSDYERWTLRGETELETVTWTVLEFDAADNQINQTSYDGQSFNHTLDIERDTTRVEVRVAGTTPPVENYTYESREQFRFARFQQVRQGGTQGTIDAYGVHHYTAESKAAREVIDNASTVVEGSGSQDAQDQLSRAIEAYNSEEFGLAQDLASDARNSARQAKQSQQTTQTLLFGGLGVLALLVVAGGVYYWRSQQDDYDKLR